MPVVWVLVCEWTRKSADTGLNCRQKNDPNSASGGTSTGILSRQIHALANSRRSVHGQRDGERWPFGVGICFRSLNICFRWKRIITVTCRNREWCTSGGGEEGPRLLRRRRQMAIVTTTREFKRVAGRRLDSHAPSQRRSRRAANSPRGFCETIRRGNHSGLIDDDRW